MGQSIAYFDVIPPDKLKIGAYEVLFKALAREGMIEELKRIWFKLKNNGICPSLKCYIAAFQCLGNQDKNNAIFEDWSEELHSDLKELFSKDGLSFDFDCLLVNCTPRTQKDYENLIDGIRIVSPDYMPSYYLDQKGENVYKQNDLLKDLYNFPLKQLQPQISDFEFDKLLPRQFDAEINGYVTIESIASDVEYTDPEVEKANEFCQDLVDNWKHQLRLTLGNKLNKRFLKWRKHISGKDVTLPTSAFIDVIPLGMS